MNETNERAEAAIDWEKELVVLTAGLITVCQAHIQEKGGTDAFYMLACAQAEMAIRGASVLAFCRGARPTVRKEPVTTTYIA